MTGFRENGLTHKEQLLRTLEREIFAAEMKVILDKELGRPTSPTVRRLAALKMPPIYEQRSARGKTDQPASGRARKEQLLRTLRREIFAAEMKVILDKELGRETSEIVKRLAALKLPPDISFKRP